MLQDSDDGEMHILDNSDIPEIISATSSEEPLHDRVCDAFAESPVVRKIVCDLRDLSEQSGTFLNI